MTKTMSQLLDDVRRLVGDSPPARRGDPKRIVADGETVKVGIHMLDSMQRAVHDHRAAFDQPAQSYCVSGQLRTLDQISAEAVEAHHAMVEAISGSTGLGRRIAHASLEQAEKLAEAARAEYLKALKEAGRPLAYSKAWSVTQ